MKAIDTVYNGYKFRSRLEARWAVFFDTMKFGYLYEPEGFNLDGIFYLPDFYLLKVNMWAEVKPEKFNEAEIKKARLLAEHSGRPVLMLVGLPEMKNYWAYQPEGFICDYIISNYHNYYQKENRFFGDTGLNSDSLFDTILWMCEDMQEAVTMAKQARFEHRT